MKKYIIILITILFNVLVSAQTQEESKETHELAIGQKLQKGETSVKFIEVISDSRCPENVTCIWQGEATILLGITLNEEYFEKEIAISGGLQKALKFGETEVIIGYLKPYPKNAEKIPLEKYCLEIAF